MSTQTQRQLRKIGRKGRRKRKRLTARIWDYRAYFQSVSQLRLLRKVENCRIIDQVKIWIKGFLQCRQPVETRVRVDDLPQVVEYSVDLLADDTKLFSVIQYRGGQAKASARHR